MFFYSSYHLNISFPSSGSHFNKLERVLETPKNGFVSTVTLWITLNKTNPRVRTKRITLLLKSSYPKKYLPNFRTQKNPGIENFKPPKNPSIIPVTWNPEYPPLGKQLTDKYRYDLRFFCTAFISSKWNSPGDTSPSQNRQIQRLLDHRHKILQ